MNTLIIKSLVSGLLSASVSITGGVSAPANPTQIATAPVERKADKLDAWINSLVNKESEGRSHIKILDHNARYSYGCLQFQMETFEGYVKRYELLPNTEDSELENMIYDCDFQKLLTRKMIEENPENWRHWYTSVAKRGLGVPPVIKINQLAGK